MLVMLLGLPLGVATQAEAQDLSLDPIVETADEETAKPKKKKKSKKKKATKKKSSKKKDKADDADVATDTEADDADGDDDDADEKAEPEEGKVAQALRKFKSVSGKPNMKADYYIYMYSASWCGYCKQCMPDAVAEYKKIRRSKKVEFIVIGGDKSRDEAKAYLKEYKAKMPCIYFDDVKATKFMGLPGCGMPGFPAISVADKDGKVIKTAVGAAGVKEVIKDWKKLTIDRDKED